MERDQFPTNRPHDRVGVFRYRRENDTASMRSPFGGAKIGYELRQRVGEIFVIAYAEAVALHDDVAAEAGWVIIERDDGSAFFGGEDWIGDGVAARGK